MLKLVQRDKKKIM